MSVYETVILLILLSRLKKKDQEPQAQVRVNAGQKIVGHDPDPSPQFFQAPHREWFEYIKNTKQDKTQTKINPGKGQKVESYQNPGHFVDNDFRGVLPCQEFGTDIGRPDGEDDEKEDENASCKWTETGRADYQGDSHESPKSTREYGEKARAQGGSKDKCKFSGETGPEK